MRSDTVDSLEATMEDMVEIGTMQNKALSDGVYQTNDRSIHVIVAAMQVLSCCSTGAIQLQGRD